MIDKEVETMKIQIKIGKPCLKQNLKVPAGYRLIKDWEFLRELRSKNDAITKLSGNYWIEIAGEVKASLLDLFDGSSNFVAYERDIGSHYALRGVFTKKRAR